MSKKVHIHPTLRQFTNGRDMVEVEGNRVGDCLNHLVKQYPGIEHALFSQKGKVLNTIEIYVNMESAYPDELAKPVNDGDEIHLTLMLSGG